MTVPLIVAQDQNRIDYSPDGVEDTFAYNFEVDNEEWMFVYADGEPYLEPFTITGIGLAEGGDVIFDTPPSASITELTLVRIVPITQETVYPEYGPFPAKSHEKALDKLTWIDQQQEEVLARCWKNPIDGGTFDFTIDEPIADRALVWNPAGDGITNGPTLEEISNAEEYAERAEAAANSMYSRILNHVIGPGGQSVFDLGFNIRANNPNFQFYAQGILMFDAFPCDAGGVLVTTGFTNYINAGGSLPEGTLVKVYSSTVLSASSGTPTITYGIGDPEGVETATIGSLYMRSDGGAGTSLYVKETGSGNTGWIAK